MSSSRNCLCLSWKLRLLVTWLDFFHKSIRFFSRSRQKAFDPRRILLSNWASLGDLFLATSLVPILKHHFPDCKIGFLVSKNSSEVLATCTDIDWVHAVETPFMETDWQYKTAWQRFISYLRFTFCKNRAIAAEIAQKKYTSALELYPYFPNTIPILWHAKIPFRIGFNTGGYSHLLDQTIPWRNDCYLTKQYESLLELLHIPLERPLQAALRVDSSLLPPSPYFLFHPGTSHHSKEFSLSFWQELYQLCQKRKIPIYFTGHGAKEERFIRDIGAENNFYRTTSWSSLTSLIAGSAGVVSVDSVPVHIAAALGVPFAVLYKKYSPLWFPKGGTAFWQEDLANILEWIHAQYD
ncbi:MAG: glycosyltransferase family 9 protein [Verrucomicrobiota bacterium]|nr:glycosyltransferase family 9 protein [Verrucomicrobiota bacterium]